jgi:5,10-methylenetetrahydromethanopterin reductase
MRSHCEFRCWSVAIGPKRLAVAPRCRRVITLFDVLPEQRNFSRAVVAVFGTILDEGERVRLAIGAPWAGMFHFVYTGRGADAVRETRGGAAWLDIIEQIPRTRAAPAHSSRSHGGSERRRPSGMEIGRSRVGHHHRIGRQGGASVAAMKQAGATEVHFQPSGPDIPRELARFIDAVRAR